MCDVRNCNAPTETLIVSREIGSDPVRLHPQYLCPEHAEMLRYFASNGLSAVTVVGDYELTTAR